MSATQPPVIPADPREAALDQLSRSFKGVMAAIRRMRGREAQRPGELSFAQYGLLFTLCDGGSLSSRELALRAELSPASATEMLDGLAAAGLVARERSDRDKRIVLTSLTERGQGLVAERRSRYEGRWRESVAEFSDRELHTAGEVLDRLRAMFDELAESETD